MSFALSSTTVNTFKYLSIINNYKANIEIEIDYECDITFEQLCNETYKFSNDNKQLKLQFLSFNNNNSLYVRLNLNFLCAF